MRPIRLAIIGAGRLGTFHARQAATLEAFKVVAVCDPSAGARKTLALQVGGAPFADFRDAIGLADAAVVATPSTLHFEAAATLLRVGLHVLVEKPLTPTVAQADELVDLSDHHGLTLQVGHVERFNPGLDLVRHELRRPRLIRAARTSGYTFRSTDIGAVLDLMIHDIDLALWLARSPVVEVHATGVSVLGGHEDMVDARLRFANGCVAHLTASRVCPKAERTMQVYCESVWGEIDFAARRATLIHPRPDVLAGHFDTQTLDAGQVEHYRTNLFDTLLVKSEAVAAEANAIREELIDFARAIATGESPRASGAAGRDAVAVAAQVIDCVARNGWGRQTPAIPYDPAVPTAA